MRKWIDIYAEAKAFADIEAYSSGDPLYSCAIGKYIDVLAPPHEMGKTWSYSGKEEE